MSSKRPLVVVGYRNARSAAAIQEERRARHREVVAKSWPTGRLLALASESLPAVLVLDGWLSGVDLRAVAQRPHTEQQLAVLVVGPVEPKVEVLYALAPRVSGYLPATSSHTEIADMIDTCSSGEMVVAQGTTLPLLAHPYGQRRLPVEWTDGRTAELTPKEWEVLVLLRQAYSTAEIAQRLVVAPVTVRTQIAALVRKLGVRDRTVFAGPPSAPEP